MESEADLGINIRGHSQWARSRRVTRSTPFPAQFQLSSFTSLNLDQALPFLCVRRRKYVKGCFVAMLWIRELKGYIVRSMWFEQGAGYSCTRMHPTYVVLHEMTVHDAWLYGVHKTCSETAAVSRGTSHVTTKQRCNTPLQWQFQTRYKKDTHVESYAARAQWDCLRAEKSAVWKQSTTTVVNQTEKETNCLHVWYTFRHLEKPYGLSIAN